MYRTSLTGLKALAVALMLAASHIGSATESGDWSGDWSSEQIQLLRSLWIESLPDVPPSPGNPVADNMDAARLGQRIFFDPRFSRSATVSCASCHQPHLNFQNNLPPGHGVGDTHRKTMSLVGSAYSPWFFWDGRRDSLWSQALEPLESAAEHGGTRLQLVRLLATDARYRAAYQQVFGAMPDLSSRQRFPINAGPYGTETERQAWRAMRENDRFTVSEVFSNIGRALESYERRLIPGPALFDQYVGAVLSNDTDAMSSLYSSDEEAGLRLFIGRAQCIHCHNGPLFTNNEFHNTGLFPQGTLPVDKGRLEAVAQLKSDEFNCLGAFSHATGRDCDELRYVKDNGVELVAAFRTPSLRNVGKNWPYMHSGEFETLQEVLRHYNHARPTLISDDLSPLGLTSKKLQQLEHFLHTLSAPLATDSTWLSPLVSSTPETGYR